MLLDWISISRALSATVSFVWRSKFSVLCSVLSRILFCINELDCFVEFKLIEVEVNLI